MNRTQTELAHEEGAMRVDTNEPRSLWVIGHRVTLLPVGVASPPSKLSPRRVCPGRRRTTTRTPTSPSTSPPAVSASCRGDTWTSSGRATT